MGSEAIHQGQTILDVAMRDLVTRRCLKDIGAVDTARTPTLQLISWSHILPKYVSHGSLAPRSVPEMDNNIEPITVESSLNWQLCYGIP